MEKLICFKASECDDDKNRIACATPDAIKEQWDLPEFCADVKEISKNIDVVDITAKEDKLRTESRRSYGWENVEIELK